MLPLRIEYGVSEEHWATKNPVQLPKYDHDRAFAVGPAH